MSDRPSMGQFSLGDGNHHSSDDDVSWMPVEVQQVLNLEDIPIIYYQDTNGEDILLNCSRSRHIGLASIWFRSDKSTKICLTIVDRVYVLNMNYKQQVELLRDLLIRNDLKFFIYKGPCLSSHLYARHGLRLDGQSHIVDLSTFDVFLSIRRHFQSAPVPAPHQYNIGFFTDERNKDKFPYRDLSALADFWLGINLPKCTDLDKDAVLRSPRGVKAANCIKKRACLTRALGLKMTEYFDDMVRIPERNVFAFVENATDQELDEWETEGDCSYELLVTRHLGR